MTSRSGSGIRIGIVDSLSLVGAEIRSLLRQRRFPVSHVELIDTGGETVGTLTEVNDEAAMVTEARDDLFEGLDFVFFCGNADRNAAWIERRDEFGFVAIDLSRRTAGGAGEPVIAGVNDLEVDGGSSLIVSPHAAAIPLALLLHQIQKSHSIRHVTASVIQPASESGNEGVDELLQQAIAALNLSAIPKRVFDRQAVFNAFPTTDAPEIERLIVEQVRQTLGSDAPTITISITQGSMFHGHAIALFVQSDDPPTAEQVLSTLEDSTMFRVLDEPAGSLDAAENDEIVIARVHADPDAGGFWIWAASDNLRRSALNAVLIAESVMATQIEPTN